MGKEIEAKIKVTDLESVRRRLAEQSAKREGSELETNIFFDARDSSLRKSGKGLRIRVAVGEGGKRHCTMTFKGPLLPGELKTREEIEFSIDDPGTAQALLENLGFVATLTFEKRRETWLLGECKVELDHLPHLGTYVEIEGPGEEQVMEVGKRLGMAELPLISTSYVSMLARYLGEHGITDRYVRL